MLAPLSRFLTQTHGALSMYDNKINKCVQWLYVSCQVLCEYAARGGDSKPHLSEEKLLAKFQKKITKNPRLKVHKEKVKLLK